MPAPSTAPDLRTKAAPYLPDEDLVGWSVWTILVGSESLRRCDAACVSEEQSLIGYTARWFSIRVREKKLDQRGAETMARTLVDEMNKAAGAPGWTPLNKTAIGKMVNDLFKRLHPAASIELGVHDGPATVEPLIRVPDGYETWQALAERLASVNDWARRILDEMQSGTMVTVPVKVRRRLLEIHAQTVQASDTAGTRPPLKRAARTTLQQGARPGEYDAAKEPVRKY